MSDSPAVGAPLELSQCHAVITGGGSGIGAAIALALADQGTKLTLMGRNRERLERRLRDLPQAQAISVDICDPAQVKAGFQQAENTFGSVSILVNSAGAAESAPLKKMDSALWQRMLDVNLSGVFYCSQVALGGMREQRWGRIINIASTAGLKGYAYVSAYCAAKHGVVGFTRALALETAGEGITVNAVCPGFTETGLLDQTLARIVATTGRSMDQARDELARINPQKRLVQPAQVADAVLWLCRPESAAVTGQAIAIAGGEVM